MLGSDLPVTEPLAQPETFRDEEGEVRASFVASVATAIATENRDALAALVGDLHESDLGELIEALESEDRPRLIALLGRDFDFTALTEVDDAVREEILEEVPNEAIAEGVRDLDTDDAVYILEDLDAADQEEVLAKLPADERGMLERSLDYPEESAGRRMQTEFIAVPPFWTVGQTIDFMRDAADLPGKFYQLFVIDAERRVLGGVGLDQLLRSKRPVRIEAIMEPEEHQVRVDEDQEEVADIFKRYNLVTMPVIDADERLVGVLTFDDIVDVIEQEADEDIRALAGVKPDEELSDSVWTLARGRFSWLFINLITAFLASSVLKGFAGQLEKMVALAVLAPIVASQGGNAATQTMTVVVRAIATRELDRANALRVIGRELLAGSLNGLAFAVITGLIAAYWFGTYDLGIVIGIAMIVNLIAAALGGATIPLVLDAFGIDPAVSSAPFVTTVTDIVGFFAFLGVATLWFGLA
ncbi:MAG TPA: magnesium transporter [Beijerinckiaceae bacterium]|nr:magnesium transporter [Beijerinckiaceae bacterium]